MKALKASLIILTLMASLCKVSFSDTQGALPKIGFAKNDGSNVRAGDNINYETLCKLKQGDPVKIIDERYSWYKIILPETAHLYIKSDYVDLIDKKGTGEVLSLSKGKVNAARVNLRAGPGTKYSILGQVSMPQELSILSERDGWFKIKPPEGIAGWMHASQVMFKLELVEPAGAKTKSKPEVKEVKKELKLAPVKRAFSKSLVLERKAPEPKGNLTFSTQSQ